MFGNARVDPGVTRVRAVAALRYGVLYPIAVVAGVQYLDVPFLLLILVGVGPIFAFAGFVEGASWLLGSDVPSTSDASDAPEEVKALLFGVGLAIATAVELLGLVDLAAARGALESWEPFVHWSVALPLLLAVGFFVEAYRELIREVDTVGMNQGPNEQREADVPFLFGLGALLIAALGLLDQWLFLFAVVGTTAAAGFALLVVYWMGGQEEIVDRVYRCALLTIAALPLLRAVM